MCFLKCNTLSWGMKNSHKKRAWFCLCFFFFVRLMLIWVSGRTKPPKLCHSFWGSWKQVEVLELLNYMPTWSCFDQSQRLEFPFIFSFWLISNKHLRDYLSSRVKFNNILVCVLHNFNCGFVVTSWLFGSVWNWKPYNNVLAKNYTHLVLCTHTFAI